jgi:hypothetical protein
MRYRQRDPTLSDEIQNPATLAVSFFTGINFSANTFTAVRVPATQNRLQLPTFRLVPFHPLDHDAFADVSGDCFFWYTAASRLSSLWDFDQQVKLAAAMLLPFFVVSRWAYFVTKEPKRVVICLGRRLGTNGPKRIGKIFNNSL